jgi:hypothetical protein
MGDSSCHVNNEVKVWHGVLWPLMFAASPWALVGGPGSWLPAYPVCSQGRGGRASLFGVFPHADLALRGGWEGECNFKKLLLIKKVIVSLSQAPVAHSCNPSYSESRDQED